MNLIFLRRFWWVAVLAGVIILLLGVALFFKPDFSQILFIQQSGWLLATLAVVYAAFYFFIYQSEENNTWKQYAFSALGLVVGILIATYAEVLSTAINWVLGGYALWLGIVQLVAAYKATGRAHFSWITGVLSLLLGALMIWNPDFMNLNYLLATYAAMFGAWLIYVGAVNK